MKTLYVMAYVCALIGCGGATEAPQADQAESGTATTTDSATPAVDSATPATDSATPTSDSETKPSDTATPSDTGTITTETGGTAGEPGKINCGPTLKCATPQVCCIGFAGGASYSCAAMCSGLSAAAKCDGPEDCMGGQRCCSGFPSGASCKATCGSGDQDMCHVDTDCTGGKTCKACSTPGGGPSMRFCVEGGKCPF